MADQNQQADETDEPTPCNNYYSDGPHPSNACGLSADHWPLPHSWEVQGIRDGRGDLWVRDIHGLWVLPGDQLSARTIEALRRLNGPLTPEPGVRWPPENVTTPPAGGEDRG